MRNPAVSLLQAFVRRPGAPALLVLALGCAGQLVPPALAQPTVVVRGSLERSVKAAFLYKFLGYTEFPASAFSDPAAPVVLGVMNSAPMASELTRIVTGRTVNNRPIVVRSMKEGDAMAGVHLLFIAGADSARVVRSVSAARPQPLLVVTESADGLQEGSVINFKIIDERVRFDVSLDAAGRNSVKLSSRLLMVAHQVHQGAD